jgi:hypothetical protein
MSFAEANREDATAGGGLAGSVQYPFLQLGATPTRNMGPSPACQHTPHTRGHLLKKSRRQVLSTNKVALDQCDVACILGRRRPGAGIRRHAETHL